MKIFRGSSSEHLAEYLQLYRIGSLKDPVHKIFHQRDYLDTVIIDGLSIKLNSLTW